MTLRTHLSFANVASATALALVLGGGVAVAAGLAPNSVGSAQIKAQAVKSSDVKNDSLKGKDIKESSLDAVPSVETVVADARVTAAVGAVPVTVYESTPFTITLRCVDGGGGVTQAFLEIRTSVDNAAFDANLAGGDDADLDVFDGPQTLGDTSNAATRRSSTWASRRSARPAQLLAGYGYVCVEAARLARAAPPAHVHRLTGAGPSRPAHTRQRRPRGRSRVGERYDAEVGPVAHGGHCVVRLPAPRVPGGVRAARDPGRAGDPGDHRGHRGRPVLARRRGRGARALARPGRAARARTPGRAPAVAATSSTCRSRASGCSRARWSASSSPGSPGSTST